MDSPSQGPQLLLSPCSSRRKSSVSASPEFEFWMVRNPSFPQPNLLSADELFVDGFLLPLHSLHHHPRPPDPDPPNSNPHPEPEPGPQISHTTTPLTSSKRWKDIFKKADKKPATTKTQEDKGRDKEKEKKREKKSQTGASTAELNINIWPFSRSRSAGNSVARPRMFPGAPGTRKVSSAPCSRSNSGGESKSRKWPSSPGRAGVHLGRSSPVWQVRRGGGSGGSAAKNGYNYFEPAGIRSNEKIVSKKEVTESNRSKTTAAGGGGGSNTKTRAVNLNVPMCMGYREHLRCRDGGEKNRGNSGNNVGSGRNNIFNLRSLFTKKVY